MLNPFKRYQKISARKIELERYRKDGGDYALRFNYDLDENSVVLDLGGYMGQWASDLHARYRCEIHIFEPVGVFARMISKRFSKNPAITTHNFGLGDADKQIAISLDADASSIYDHSGGHDHPGERQTIQIKNASRWLEDSKIDRVSLAKINIEGGEYELIENLLLSGKIRMFDNLQIQFHDFFPEAEARMLAIQQTLKETHVQIYQYRFVWESWTRK